MKVFCTIVFYNPLKEKGKISSNIAHLNRLIKEYRSFSKYEVFINVVTNFKYLNDHINVDSISIIENIKDNNGDYLPCYCKISLLDNIDKDFDLYIFSEDDHLIQQKHLDNHLKYSNILPKDRIPGLFQYEKNAAGKIFFPAWHYTSNLRRKFDWDYNSVETFSNLKFASFENIHQACFILTKEQILRLKEYSDYFNHANFPFQSHNGISKPHVNIDALRGVKQGSPDLWKKVICISDFEDNLVHHLPNKYLDSWNKECHNTYMKEFLNKLK